MQVVIVGAGLAGLTRAYRLCRNGVTADRFLADCHRGALREGGQYGVDDRDFQGHPR